MSCLCRVESSEVLRMCFQSCKGARVESTCILCWNLCTAAEIPKAEKTSKTDPFGSGISKFEMADARTGGLIFLRFGVDMKVPAPRHEKRKYILGRYDFMILIWFTWWSPSSQCLKVIILHPVSGQNEATKVCSTSLLNAATLHFGFCFFFKRISGGVVWRTHDDVIFVLEDVAAGDLLNVWQRDQHGLKFGWEDLLIENFLLWFRRIHAIRTPTLYQEIPHIIIRDKDWMRCSLDGKWWKILMLFFSPWFLGEMMDWIYKAYLPICLTPYLKKRCVQKLHEIVIQFQTSAQMASGCETVAGVQTGAPWWRRVWLRFCSAVASLPNFDPSYFMLFHPGRPPSSPSKRFTRWFELSGRCVRHFRVINDDSILLLPVCMGIFVAIFASRIVI